MRSGSEKRTLNIMTVGALLLVACADVDRAESCAARMESVVSAGRLPDTHDNADFRELWRVAGAEEGEYLAVPLPLAVSPDGRAAIADFQLGELFVIEPDGRWHGRLARRGMGPGELTSPVAAGWDGQGALHVYDLVKPAILHFAPDLAYVGEIRADSEAAAAIFASGGLDWAGIQPSGATVLMPGLSPAGTGFGTEFVFRIDSAAGPADTMRSGHLAMAQIDGYQDLGVPGYSRIAASVGAGGRLGIIGGDEGWLVDVYDDDGSRILRLCAAAPAQPLSAAERGRDIDDAYRDLAAAFARATPAADPARHGRIVMGADGTVWVERERQSPYPGHMRFYGDPGTTFDVFSPDGRRIRTLRLPPAARLQGALGDTIWAYEIGELEEVHLVAYEITMR
jgi:hypothetical protein